MNRQFAKLFERDGHQVLVCLSQDDPAIVVTFKDHSDDLYVSPKVSFAPKDDSDEAFEKAWELCDKAFAKIDEDWAFNLRDKTLSSLGGQF